MPWPVPSAPLAPTHRWTGNVRRRVGAIRSRRRSAWCRAVPRRGSHTPCREPRHSRPRGRHSSSPDSFVGTRGHEAPIAGVIFKQLTELPTASVEPRHDCPDRRPHDVGDLLVREALDIGEVDRDPEILGDLLESLLDVRIREMRQRLRLGGQQAGRRVRLGTRHLPVLDVLGSALLRFALLLAVRVDERVGQDAIEPGPEVRPLLVLVERSERLGERLLYQVLGVAGITRHTQRRGVQLVEVGQRVAFETRSTLVLSLFAGHHCRCYRPRRFAARLPPFTDRCRRGYRLWAVKACRTGSSQPEPSSFVGLPWHNHERRYIVPGDVPTIVSSVVAATSSRAAPWS